MDTDIRINQARALAEQIQQTIDSQDARTEVFETGGVLDRARQTLLAMETIPPVRDDHAVRDMLTKEAIEVIGDDRKRNIAQQEGKVDNKYIDVLRAAGRSHVAQLIALTARFAGELIHEYIHPRKRELMDEFRTTTTDDRELAALVVFPGDRWYDLVDPGLAGNARIACKNIGDALPRLYGLTMEAVMESVKLDGKGMREFLDFFCAAVAARKRANSVLAAGAYKTGNEQTAVMTALRDSLTLCRDYQMTNNRVHLSMKQPPCRTLSELRGLGGPFLPH
jgi:hypothetical protein